MKIFLSLILPFCFFTARVSPARSRDRDPLRSGEICQRPVISKGRVVPDHPRYYEHNTVVIICRHPYLRVGPVSATCRRRGHFSTLPKCVACENKHPENGFSRPKSRVVAVGQEVRFGCNHGYTLQKEVTQICEENGQLSGPDPVCKRNPFCSKPDSLSVEIVPDKEEYEIGEEIVYKCKPYQALQPANITSNACGENAEFDGTTPTCVNSTEPVVCKRPDSLRRRVVMRPRRDGYAVGSTVRFACVGNKYTFSGDKTSVCRGDGTFKFNNQPSCKAKPRPKPFKPFYPVKFHQRRRLHR